MVRTRRPCSPLKLENIKRLRELKLTYRKIGKIFGVSSVQIQYWLIGRNITHFTEKPEGCEICGVLYNRLNHHHWDDDNPSVGLWLCPKCHMAAEVIDETPAFSSKYLMLKEARSSMAFSK